MEKSSFLSSAFCKLWSQPGPRGPPIFFPITQEHLGLFPGSGLGLGERASFAAWRGHHGLPVKEDAVLCVTLFVQFQLSLQAQAPRAMVWDGLARRQLARLQNILGSFPAGTRPQLAALAQREGLAQQGKPFLTTKEGIYQVGGMEGAAEENGSFPLFQALPDSQSLKHSESGPLCSWMLKSQWVAGCSSQSSWPSAHCLREGLGAQPTTRVSNREMLVWRGPVDSFFFK